jgi:hypothetical protein
VESSVITTLLNKMKIILIHKQIIKITANLKLKLKLNNKLLYYQIEKNKLEN